MKNHETYNPCPLEEGTLTLNDISVNYRTWSKFGRPIVFLHGLASSQNIWNLMAPILAQKYQVTTFDQRGHGQSEKPTQGYDFETVARDAAIFIQNLKIHNPIIVGHSWGGSVALCLAVTYPELVSGLCFVDGGLIEISKVPGNSLDLALKNMAPPRWNNVKKTDLINRIRNRSWGDRDSTSKAVNLEDVVLSHLKVDENDFVSANLSRENHLKIVEEFWKHKPSTMISKIKCPTLILPARQSKSDTSDLKHEMVDMASQTIPICDVVWLEESIHDVPLQRPELVSDLIAKRIESGFFPDPEQK